MTHNITLVSGFLDGAIGKKSVCQCKRFRRRGFHPWVSREDALEKEMATHCSILTWKIPWTEDLGGL